MKAATLSKLARRRATKRPPRKAAKRVPDKNGWFPGYLRGKVFLVEGYDYTQPTLPVG